MDRKNHSETLDFLSSSWCNFAIQALKPELQDHSSMFVQDNTIKALEGDNLSWTWTQQAMNPEPNYGTGYQKKKVNWRMRPFGGDGSIKKWMNDVKENRKEEKRLQRAEVHAAVSIAGLATALAALAEEKPEGKLIKVEERDEQTEARKVALASATALIASQCAQMAKLMGAKTFQLSSVISSALKATSTSDILTLTAAASTSLRGAATLKARAGWKNRALNGTPVLPIEIDNNNLDDGLDFERCRSLLAKGVLLTIKTPHGKNMKRLVSLHLNNEEKVILRIMKRVLLNVITSKKECLVLNMQAELFHDSGRNEYDESYQIVLMTTRGEIKLDMAKDYERYKMWTTTINQMLMISPSLTK